MVHVASPVAAGTVEELIQLMQLIQLLHVSRMDHLCGMQGSCINKLKSSSLRVTRRLSSAICMKTSGGTVQEDIHHYSRDLCTTAVDTQSAAPSVVWYAKTVFW